MFDISIAAFKILKYVKGTKTKLNRFPFKREMENQFEIAVLFINGQEHGMQAIYCPVLVKLKPIQGIVPKYCIWKLANKICKNG